MDTRNNPKYGNNSDESQSNALANAQDIEIRCGYGKCRPRMLDRLNNPRVMLGIMSFYVFVQGFMVNGIFNVNVSTIERRFQIKSATMGMVVGANDLTAAVFGVLISYFGSGRYKARWLSFSSLFMVAGSVLMALPHFTTGLYEYDKGGSISKLCDENGNTNTTLTSCEPTSLGRYVGVFTASMILSGISGATLHTVGIAYIDDSVPARNSPMYIGIFYGFAMLGPGAGFIIGGLVLNLYVDFDRVNTHSLSIDTSDINWVGAWWLLPVISVIFFCVSGFSLSCFGAELPTAKVVRETRISQLHKGTATKLEAQSPTRPEVRQIPRVLHALLRNPPFVFVTLAEISDGLTIFGILTFIAKYVETVYNISASKAAVFSGVPVILGLAGGVAFGGIFCRCLNLKVKGMLKFSLITCSFSALCAAMLFATCDQKQVLGVQTAYLNSTEVPSLFAECNSNCGCTTDVYLPSCDEYGNQYFSPCHAGCDMSSDDEKIYKNCSCVASSTTGNASMVSIGSCGKNCNLMYVFLVLLFLFTFATMAAEVPAEQAIFRSVDENHRVIMVGANRFFTRLLGVVPGPVIYGAATDAGCLIWKNDCGEDTYCWIYDIDVVGRNYFIIAIVTKIFSNICLFCAFWFYKPPKEMKPEIDLKTTEVYFNDLSYNNTD